LLNDEPPASKEDQPILVSDPAISDQLFDELVEKTSGCSVEQLEQIYSALMDTIWRTRGSWDRTKVANKLREVFEEVLADMEEMQDFGPTSLEEEARTLRF